MGEIEDDRIEKTGSLSEQAYQYVRSLILTGELKPGSVFTERKLAAQLDFSRTPFRTAITRLIGEGLAERLSNGTLVIREVPLDELLQIMVIRRQLESEAAAQAAVRATPDELEELIRATQAIIDAPSGDLEAFWRYDDHFHSFVADASGMPLLAKMIRENRDRVRMCHVARMERNFSEQAREHLRVLEAIKIRDQNKAREAMAEHAHHVRERFLRWYTGQ
ncbi:GntR family transcriptional regulator [Sinirhodobacter populi]|uniref:GntR family transcriptional regulator n=1 Tax=Paenirhodobacter populi TaxID=2306993 RepID=A0A443K060_9RHOB|nr:GntR family transcriptional regulator [Sinirhodobacter populi]RWR26167.1 GntR family transcriptional regulator [Sinirhodobacter populi]